MVKNQNQNKFISCFMDCFPQTHMPLWMSLWACYSSFRCWDQTHTHRAFPLLPLICFLILFNTSQEMPLQLMKAKSIRTPPLRQDPWFKGIYLLPKNTNGLREALFFRFDQKTFSSSLYMSDSHEWAFQNTTSQSTERLLNMLLNKKQSQLLST